MTMPSIWLIPGAILALLVSSTAGSAQAPEKPHAGAVILLVDPGETKEAAMVWDRMPGGRAPAWHVLAGRDLSNDKRQALDDTPELRINGVTVKLDGERTRAFLTAMPREIPTIGPEVIAVRVTADADAKPGITNFYAHFVSGTGRTNHRVMEVRVLVGEKK